MVCKHKEAGVVLKGTSLGERCQCRLKVRDGSLFMGMTGSGKNRTGFENFSCCGDGLCVFFLNKETGL